MSTIKSSDEHLTLNADGSSKDIKFQANGVEKASISSAGAFTSTTIDATKLTGNLPAISAASLTNVPAANITGTLPAISGANLTGITNNAGSCVFRAYDNDGSWAAIATNTKIIFDSEYEDSDNVYNTSDGKFTAPNGGVYFFYANIYTGNADSANGFTFRKNDSAANLLDYHGQWGSYMSQSDASDCMVSWQLVVTLGTDDTIAVWTGTGSDIYYGHSYWGGFRLK